LSVVPNDVVEVGFPSAGLAALQERLGVKLANEELLVRALTHRSFANEHGDKLIRNNERLEFLGDAVLDFAVGHYLFQQMPSREEGDLTALRAALVRTETLAGFARQLDLGPHLRLGHGEARSGGREREAILCGAFEAIVGAIYLDSDMESVQRLVIGLVEPTLANILANSSHKDAKSELQVWSQGEDGVTPSYEVISESGPDHAKLFFVAVYLGDKQWGTGEGRSKQSAAQVAAADALERIQSDQQ